jgi:hypothetical protein
MSAKTVLVIPDQHAHHKHSNVRADYLGLFIKDLKPDLLVNMGDAADLPSLCQYDKGKAKFYANSYQKDIEAHLDFQQRMFAPMIKAKKRKPQTVFLVGNHEQRINRALEYEPYLSGDKFGISMKNLDLDTYYDEVIPYDGATPGIFNYDGVLFSHYFVSGIMGRAIGGEHHAASLLSKNLCSSVAAHSHTFDFSTRKRADGSTIMALVAGVFQDYHTDWAGAGQNFWESGVVVLRDFEEGRWDLEWLSLSRMRKEYVNEV